MLSFGFRKLGWSNFALGRHKKGTGHSYSSLTNDVVLNLVRHNWKYRTPGDGEKSLDRKVVVPIKDFVEHGPLFYCASAKLEEGMKVGAEIVRRQAGEDLYVKNFAAEINPELGEHVSIVCYSAEALLENGGERSGDYDWEIVCMLVSPIENEPMTPLTMARNFLEMPGGTKSNYTAEEFAKAIYYWSQRISIK